MTAKTPQDVFQAIHEALKTARPAVQWAYRGLPERWEDLSLEQKVIFVNMAWAMNLIAGEYMLDEQERDDGAPS